MLPHRVYDGRGENEAVGDVVLQAAAQAHNDNHCRHADDDAQHGEQGADLAGDDIFQDSIYGYTVAQGRGLQYSDIATRSKVCVVGAYVNQAYFGGNAVGQTLRVGGQALTIVGVLDQREMPPSRAAVE